MTPRPSLFLQPHYDDVALSCGGTARAVVDAGHAAHIVTVFASEVVDAMVGEFAQWKHKRWGIVDPDEVIAKRRAEDEAAARVLGCGIRWLGLPDAIYRGDHFASDEDLYGELPPQEIELARHLATELRGLPEWRHDLRVFVPLGAGSHVDHQLVFETGRFLAQAGAEVWAYEDSPYCIHTPQGVTSRHGHVARHLGDEARVPIGHTLDAKLDAIACYGTQLPVIFRFTPDWRGAVAKYCESIATGQGGAAERFWRIRG